MEKKEGQCERYRCNNPAERRKHSCPYQEEINNNNDPNYCNCCSDCRYECAMDV